MRTNFHYVLTFRNRTDVPYLEFRLEKLINRMKSADVSIVPNHKYRFSKYSDVCFYSDGKGDVHYGRRPAITA